MTFAKRTKVPVDQSRTEIEKTLSRYGATAFAYFSEPDRAMIVFHMLDRRVRFSLPLLQEKSGENERTRATRLQVNRSRWRALLLCIKAKLESVKSNIETFEQAFMAHVVMPDGKTVGEHAIPKIAAVYKSGTMQPLLPPPGHAP